MPTSELITTPELPYAIKYDPKLSPSWRFERAVELLEENEPPHPKYDDKWIQWYRRYRIERDKIFAKTRSDHIRKHHMAEKYRHLWAADQLYSERFDNRNRWEVEARILARQTPAEICQHFVLEESSVEAYERLFFNVTERLDYKAYIGSVVLEGGFMSGLASRTAETTCKFFGYFGGPLILDLVLDAFDPSVPIPEKPHELTRYIDHHFRTNMKTAALVGVTMMEPTNFNMRTLLEGYGALLSLQYRENSSQGDDNVINQAIEIFSQINPMPLGTAASQMQSRPGPAIGGGAIEPRVEEVAEVREGILPNELPTFDSGWKPPLPRKNDDDDNS